MPGAIVRGPDQDARCRPCLHLTVDDGPDPAGTPLWLTALDRHAAQAVFFLSADRARQHPDWVRAIIEAGHRVGNHGDAHRSAWRMMPAQTIASFERAQADLGRLAGTPVRDVRPPYGRVTPGLARWAQRNGRRLVLWDVMPGDFDSRQSPEHLADEIVRLARRGSIVTLHDGPPAERAVAALDIALPKLAAAGWRFPVLPR